MARYDKISAERSGDPAPVTPPAAAGTALGILSPVRQYSLGPTPDAGQAGYARMDRMPPVPETSAGPADPAVVNDYDSFAESYSAETEANLVNAYYARPAILALPARDCSTGLALQQAFGRYFLYSSALTWQYATRLIQLNR